MAIDVAMLADVAAKYELAEIAVLIAMVVICMVVSALVPPFCRTFRWNDPTIAYPMTNKDTFPNYSLMVMAILVLVFFVVFVKFVAHKGPLRPWIMTHLWAFGLQISVVNLIKVYAGRFRPDFIARVRKAGYESPAAVDICQLRDTNSMVHEGMLSFPSGHSSTSFEVSVVLTLFLFAHLRPFSGQRGGMIRASISLLPMALGVICAVSRTRDYRHHFDDILAGSIIGTVCTIIPFMVYFQYTATPDTICMARTRKEEWTASQIEVAEENEVKPFAVNYV